MVPRSPAVVVYFHQQQAQGLGKEFPGPQPLLRVITNNKP